MDFCGTVCLIDNTDRIRRQEKAALTYVKHSQ
jgi:hypothetical protein